MDTQDVACIGYGKARTIFMTIYVAVVGGYAVVTNLSNILNFPAMKAHKMKGAVVFSIFIARAKIPKWLQCLHIYS